MSTWTYRLGPTDVEELLEGGTIVLPDIRAIPSHIEIVDVILNDDALQLFRSRDSKNSVEDDRLIDGIAYLLWSLSVNVSPLLWTGIAPNIRTEWQEKAEVWLQQILGISPQDEAEKET